MAQNPQTTYSIGNQGVRLALVMPKPLYWYRFQTSRRIQVRGPV